MVPGLTELRPPSGQGPRRSGLALLQIPHQGPRRLADWVKNSGRPPHLSSSRTGTGTTIWRWPDPLHLPRGQVGGLGLQDGRRGCGPADSDDPAGLGCVVRRAATRIPGGLGWESRDSGHLDHPVGDGGGQGHRHSGLAERSHMAPDQQACSPHIAQWRPPSPVARSPLAPVLLLATRSSAAHRCPHARHRARSVRHSAGFNFVCLIDIHWGTRPPAIYARSLSGNGNKEVVLCF